MYYDLIAMKENNDTEAFDFDKSEIIEVRSYFENDKIIHKIENGNKEFIDLYSLGDTNKIIYDFNRFYKQKKKY
jgi:hypothetical protein